MQKVLVLIGIATLLASCTQQSGVSNQEYTGTPTGQNAPFPQTADKNPATDYCVEQGGTVTVEQTSSDIDMAFCTLEDGTKRDAWELFDESTRALKLDTDTELDTNVDVETDTNIEQ